MIRGIQSAAAGMIAQQEGQDAIANNLANVNASGYKRDIPSFGAALSAAAGAAPTSQMFVTHGVDFTQGPLQETGNTFHLALEGEGMFAVETANGTAYTRSGAFASSADGYLTTSAGEKVLGEGGPIRVAGGFSVDEQGKVLSNGAVADTLRIVKFDSPDSLRKIGGSLWASTTPPTQAVGARVKQGYLEGSNVSTVGEMVSMITGMRTYEASQKAIQSQDETLDKLVNEVGRPG